MTPFMGKDFLLSNDTARTLYHQHAARMPIIDYHCHINPAEIAEDRHFSTITQVWLGGDHYKWRAMRSAGVPERCITGDASDEEKFHACSGTSTSTNRSAPKTLPRSTSAATPCLHERTCPPAVSWPRAG